MKQYSMDKIKNVVFLGHSSSGKTTTVETLLFNNGTIKRLGSVDDGTSQVDYLAFEVEEKFTISLKIFPVEYKDCKINVIDTPGYADFMGDVLSAMGVAETSVMILDAPSGVQVHTLKLWRYLKKYNKPTIFFINKMDKERAGFENCISSIKEKLGAKLIILQVPIGEAENFKGIVDLLTMKAYTTAKDGVPKAEPIPESMKDMVAEHRKKMIESIVENDEALMEKYFDDQEITEEELSLTLQKSIGACEVMPVLCGSASLNVGVNRLLETLVSMAPSAETTGRIKGVKGEEEVEILMDSSGKFVGQVFKTIVEEHLGKLLFTKVYRGKLKPGMSVYIPRANTTEKVGQIAAMVGKSRITVDEVGPGDIAAIVKAKDMCTGDTIVEPGTDIEIKLIELPTPLISLAVKPKSTKDQEKLSNALSSFSQEDPTFRVNMNKEFAELVISGMGELHLNIMLKRLKSKYDVELNTRPPRIPFRETITKVCKGHGKYKKQSGGRGQYGECYIKMEPLHRGEGFVFDNQIFGGAIPGGYVPSVEKGIVEAMGKGVIAGYPVIDIKVILYDGTYHEVDSSDMAFRIAGSFAFKDGFEKAGGVLLEPIIDVEVEVPQEFMGDVIGDLSSRRGKIQGSDTDSGFTIVKAKVPQREMSKYANDLRSFTGGQGTFTSSFSNYEIAPADIANKIIEESQRFKEEEENK